MESILEFVVENYLWFIIISVVLIFALIGYIVDSKNVKEKNKTEDNNEPNELVVEDMNLGMETANSTSTATPEVTENPATIEEPIVAEQQVEEVKPQEPIKEETLVEAPKGITLNEQIKKNVMQSVNESAEIKPISLGTTAKEDEISLNTEKQ